MYYTASLDKLAKAVTAFVLGLYFLMLILMLYRKTNIDLIIPFLPLIILAIAFLYRPVSYKIQDGSLIINKQIGKTSIPLNTIERVEVLEDDALRYSVRTFASGGFFGYFGYFWKNNFGSFLLYGTQRKNFLLLVLKNGKKIVLTPDDPIMAEAIKDKITVGNLS